MAFDIEETEHTWIQLLLDSTQPEDQELLDSYGPFENDTVALTLVYTPAIRNIKSHREEMLEFHQMQAQFFESYKYV